MATKKKNRSPTVKKTASTKKTRGSAGASSKGKRKAKGVIQKAKKALGAVVKGAVAGAVSGAAEAASREAGMSPVQKESGDKKPRKTAK